MHPFLTKSKSLIVLGSDLNTLEIWAIDGDSRPRFVLRDHSEPITCFTVSDDESLIVTGSADCTVKIWKVDTGALVKTLRGHKGAITQCRFPPNHIKFVFSGSLDKTAKLWNIESTHVVSMDCQVPICSCVISNDARIFVTAESNIVKIWNALGQLKHTVNFEDTVVAMRLTQDNQRLIVACQNQGIKLHNLMKSVPQKRFLHPGLLSGIELPTDASFLFAFGTDRTCRLLLLSDELQELHKFEGHNGAVTSVAYCLSEYMIATASEDKTVKLWNLTNKKEIAALKGHTSSVNCVKFSKCGKLITSGGSDKNVIVWDLKTLSPKFDLFHARRMAAQTEAVHEYDAKYFGELRLKRRSDVFMRKWMDGDQENLVKHLNNRKISKNLPDSVPCPYTLADAIAWVDSNVGPKVDPLEPTQLAVCVDDEGVVGGIGVTSMSDVLRRNMIISFWIGESLWGQGIMTEAVNTFVDYVFETFPDVHRIEAQVPSSCFAAPKVLQKLGFRVEGRLKQAFVKNEEFFDLTIYGRLRAEQPTFESCENEYSIQSNSSFSSQTSSKISRRSSQHSIHIKSPSSTSSLSSESARNSPTSASDSSDLPINNNNNNVAKVKPRKNSTSSLASQFSSSSSCCSPVMLDKTMVGLSSPISHRRMKESTELKSSSK